MGNFVLFAVFLSIALLPKCLGFFLKPLSPEEEGVVLFIWSVGGGAGGCLGACSEVQSRLPDPGIWREDARGAGHTCWVWGTQQAGASQVRPSPGQELPCAQQPMPASPWKPWLLLHLRLHWSDPMIMLHEAMFWLLLRWLRQPGESTRACTPTAPRVSSRPPGSHLAYPGLSGRCAQ